MGAQIAWGLIGLVVGIIAGFLIARLVTKKMLEKEDCSLSFSSHRNK